MGTIRKIIAGTIFLMSVTLYQAAAQDGVVWSTKADSLAAAGQAVPDSLYRGFNALDYSMQRRYRPVDEMLYRKADSAYVFGGDRRGYTFIGIGSGFNFLWDSGLESYSYARGIYFDIGRRVHQYNSWRIGLSASQLFRNTDYRNFWAGGLSAEHNFYISSYLNGFRRIRPFDIYTVAGLGADVLLGSTSVGTITSDIGSVTISPYLKLGFGFQFKFGERTSLILCPQYYLYPTSIVAYNSGEGNIDARAYNSGLSVRGGLQFDLGDCFDGSRTKEMRLEDYSSLDAPVFLAVQAGVQFQNGQAMWDTSNILAALRESVGLSLGKWITPVLGVRGSLYHGRNVWKKFNSSVDDRNKTCMYDALRMEVMLDPFGSRKTSRQEVKFSLPFIFGVETGMLIKKEQEFDIRRAYAGISTGLQLKYHFLTKSAEYEVRRFAVFLEPHCSLAPYTFNDVENGKLSSRSKNYWDAVISLTLGLEVSLGK